MPIKNGAMFRAPNTDQTPSSGCRRFRTLTSQYLPVHPWQTLGLSRVLALTRVLWSISGTYHGQEHWDWAMTSCRRTWGYQNVNRAPIRS
ncbi:hypothetical protein Agabi119p4_6059 [Agaricus bisporus var. burnettii]|uniref:Uncharacterized protein n=1 Tax=Agaricus bisporus var. burnettii TaxID=192524 RepID=A0A8H7KF77_AGABI|nr:hypothetical protein Agabi119p4_6059 [Agaricus bisporus var. burnettii]